MTDLSAVVVPTRSGELDAIIGNLSVWAHPDYAPFVTPPGDDAPRLVFMFNSPPGEQARDRILRGYESNHLSTHFDSVEVVSLDLTDERDRYERDYSAEVGDEGYKAGPNNQFLLAMRTAAEYGRYCFLMETDCAPVRRGWLERLTALCSHPASFWIMGSAYRGVDKLDPRFARHINGNAVYAAGDPEFQQFITDFWEPRLRHAVKSEDKRLAYDCILERAFNTGEFWPIWQDTAHRFQYTDFIQNLSAAGDLLEDGAALVSRILESSPGTFVIHNSEAAAVMRERFGVCQAI